MTMGKYSSPLRERRGKMKYISVSPFWVFEEIEKGRGIYAVDKQAKEMYILNDMGVGVAVELVKDAKDHPDKYEFWYEETEEEENA